MSDSQKQPTNKQIATNHLIQARQDLKSHSNTERKKPRKKSELEFNLREIVPGASANEPQVWSLDKIMRTMEHLDENAPYQRKIVWKESMMQDFIKSLLARLPISPIHLVKKNKRSKGYWILDGKQRIAAIREFIRNLFSIKLVDQDGKLRTLFWRDIQQHFEWLEEDFITISVNVVVWEPMPMLVQKTIFEKINQCIPISKDEILYGTNFNFAGFLNYLYKNHFEQIKNLAQPKIAKNKRNFGIRVIHTILYLAFGQSLEEEFAPKGYAGKFRRRSACTIEEKLINEYKVTFEDIWDKTLITRVKFKNITTLFDNACRWFKDMATYNNNLEKVKKFDSGIFIDILVFLIKLQQDDAISSPFVRDNIEKLSTLLCQWIETRETNKIELNTKTQDRGTVEKRFRTLEEVAIKIGLDLGKKYKTISTPQKNIAALKAKPNDPITGAALRDDNAQIDHVLAKSVFSETPVALLTNTTNESKSASTPQFNEKMSNYFNTNLDKNN